MLAAAAEMSVPEWCSLALCVAVLLLFVLTTLDAWEDRWQRDESNERDYEDDGR